MTLTSSLAENSGWPVMVYSALIAAVPAAAFFQWRWGVTLAAAGVPL